MRIFASRKCWGARLCASTTVKIQKKEEDCE